MTNIRNYHRVYPVLGDPIAQVQMPRLIEPVIAALGHPVTSFALHVRPDDLAMAISTLRAMPNVAGFGVTVPHKVASIAFCDRLTDVARDVGAINNIRREADGTLTGGLYDGEGFVAGLGKAADKLRGASVVLIGAGGAGRAIAHALALRGIDALHIIDRDPEALRATAGIADAAAGRKIFSEQSIALDEATMLINATPLGLKAGDVLPVDLEALTSNTFVADIAALARRSELLELAQSLGCETSDGEAMIKGQLDLVAQFISGLID